MANTNTVKILIDGREFAHFTSVKILRQLDSFSSVEFEAPFEADRKEFRETFRPFSFKPLELFVDDVRVFTGRLVGVDPEGTPERRTVAVTGYAKPATMGDCTAPPSSLPTEFRKLSLADIAKALAAPFDVGVIFRADAGAKFAKVKLTVDRRIGDFIAELARQRNLVVTNTADGDLLCWQSVRGGSPVVRLREYEQPVIGVKAAFNPQDYFSEITGYAAKKRKRRGSKYTAPNPFLSQVLRPTAFKLEDTEPADTPTATKAKLGRMFAAMCSYEVRVATWRDPAGALWTENTIATLHAPDQMCYRETEFLIRSVELEQDVEKETASLNLVLPGAFAGELPERLPWDE